jgi:hypothetical protein
MENDRITATFKVNKILFTMFIPHPKDSIRDGMVITRISIPSERKNLNTEKSVFHIIREVLQRINDSGFLSIKVGVEQSDVAFGTDYMLGHMPFQLQAEANLVNFTKSVAIESEAQDLEITKDLWEEEDEAVTKGMRQLSEAVKEEIARRK